MKRILIADASKASLVMTSEVFKDHFPGVQVVVARTSADAIELAKTAGELDAFIIDYDLPDRDGAYTAARLKKMFTQPILITAFDRPDVQESIDRELAAFDDCLSWLKKPVKTELVVSLAQRFIEGQYRCQRRLSCAVPAFIEVEFTPAAHLMAAAGQGARTMQVARAKVVAKPKAKGGHQAKAKSSSSKPSKGKVVSAPTGGARAPAGGAKKVASTAKSTPKTTAKTSQAKTKTAPLQKTLAAGTKAQKTAVSQKKAQPAAPLKPVRKFIPVIIDDVSLGGTKIRVNNKELILSMGGKGKSAELFCDFREGQILSVVVPPGNIIEAGADALDKWQKAQSKLLSGMTQKDGSGGAVQSTEAGSKSSTLRNTARRTQKPLVAESQQDVVQGNTHVLRGEVRWTASNETFTFCGLRSETINVSKKLFESMIEIESRARSQMSPMVSPNIPRAPKLNA